MVPFSLWFPLCILIGSANAGCTVQRTNSVWHSTAGKNRRMNGSASTAMKWILIRETLKVFCCPLGGKVVHLFCSSTTRYYSMVEQQSAVSTSGIRGSFPDWEWRGNQERKGNNRVERSWYSGTLMYQAMLMTFSTKWTLNQPCGYSYAIC